MSTEVVTCAEDTPLPELTRLLRSSDAGRVAVLRGDEVVGVVARSDLLQALGEPPAREEPEERHDLRQRLLALPDLERVFEVVQAVGEGFEGVYLVGGAVRDLLMDEPSFDVDIAVEGDGIAFGRSLAAALGGRVVPHDKFGTAVVLHDGGRIDVATARTEFYDYPGALPAVEQASIREDLYRRDFTINALAVSLKGEDFGRLVDFFGGLRDLEERVVRVLHNLSFIDDPTRLFRALRYENRYGFRMESHTQGLARACVEMELVGELSSARLRDELEALLSEQEVAGALRRLGELRLDRAIHPHLAADEDAVALVAELDELRQRFASETPLWRPRLAALARRLPPDELYSWFERLRLRRRDADRIADAVTVAARLREVVAATDEPAALRALAEPHDPDGLLMAMAGAGDDVRARLERYFEELRDVRLGDLRRGPGRPRPGRVSAGGRSAGGGAAAQAQRRGRGSRGRACGRARADRVSCPRPGGPVLTVEIFVWLLPFLIVSLVLHELAHAYVATWLGDPSPRADGRLSFNPIVHLDPLGTAMFVITALVSSFIFGWAKPVMVNPRYFRRPQIDMALVAVAGPATNLLLALGCVAWLIHGNLDGTLQEVVIRAFEVNVVLGVFNLIPIPPLDGSRIVAAVMPRALHARWSQLDQVGMIALFAVIFVFNDQFWNVFSDVLDETTRVMVNIVTV